jgi:hypothetical protein
MNSKRLEHKLAESDVSTLSRTLPWILVAAFAAVNYVHGSGHVIVVIAAALALRLLFNLFERLRQGEGS